MRVLVGRAADGAQGSRPMQRWYQPCMQEPKARKEAEAALSGGEEREEEVVARAPTIHEGLVFALRAVDRRDLQAQQTLLRCCRPPRGEG